VRALFRRLDVDGVRVILKKWREGPRLAALLGKSVAGRHRSLGSPSPNTGSPEDGSF